MKCPKCSSKNLVSTMMSSIVLRVSAPDTVNDVTCHQCGYKAKAAEFGGIFEPLRGTEDWTEEQCEQWHRDFRDGKIPIHEEVGMAIYNTRAIQNIKI